MRRGWPVRRQRRPRPRACSARSGPHGSSCCRRPTPSSSRRTLIAAAMSWAERLDVDVEALMVMAACRRRGRGRGRRGAPAPGRSTSSATRRCTCAACSRTTAVLGAIAGVLAAGGLVAAIGPCAAATVRPDARPARRRVHARPRSGVGPRRRHRHRELERGAPAPARDSSPTPRSSSCPPGRRSSPRPAPGRSVGDAAVHGELPSVTPPLTTPGTG